MRLGELLDAIKHADGNANVVFDFCRCRPTGIDSWRGIYAELALTWAPPNSDHTDVATFRTILEGAIGKTFTGYKGGEYRMDASTKVHIDNGGECTDTDLVAVRVREFEVLLLTQRRDD